MRRDYKKDRLGRRLGGTNLYGIGEEHYALKVLCGDFDCVVRTCLTSPGWWRVWILIRDIFDGSRELETGSAGWSQ